MLSQQDILECIENARIIASKKKFTTGEIISELVPIIRLHTQRIERNKQREVQSPPPPRSSYDLFDFLKGFRK